MADRTVTITKPGNYSFTLAEPDDSLTVRGAIWVKGRRNWPLHLTIIHAAPRTVSRVTLRSVVSRGHVSLTGTVIVKPEAAGTDAFLSEKVLLLSAAATGEAIPNLEIGTDDVKCAHAAAVGTVDEEELFYLSSRGLSRSQAIALIAAGFLQTG